MIITIILLKSFLFVIATGINFSIFPRLRFFVLRPGLKFVHDWCTKRRWCIYSWTLLRLLCLVHYTVVIETLTFWYWHQFVGSEVSLRSSLGYSPCWWHRINWRLACWNLTHLRTWLNFVILRTLSEIFKVTVYVLAWCLAVYRLWPLAVHGIMNNCCCLRTEDWRQLKVYALMSAWPILLICVAVFQWLWASLNHHF